MTERVPTACDGCCQHDDHPKAHIGGATKHHDCLSAPERAFVVASSPTAAAVVEACESGLRGPDLLSHIQSLHQEA